MLSLVFSSSPLDEKMVRALIPFFESSRRNQYSLDPLVSGGIFRTTWDETASKSAPPPSSLEHLIPEESSLRSPDLLDKTGGWGDGNWKKLVRGGNSLEEIHAIQE